MADIDSAIPVRSVADGTDERVQVKIVDATSPDSQQMVVDSDGNSHVESHGNNPSGGDEVLRLSELGAIIPDGVYDASNNTDPGNIGLVALVRDASPADSQQTLRITATADGSGDTRALDMSLHDEAGEPYSSTNPLPVTIEASEGAEVHDPDTASAVAKDASANHDYSIADTDVFRLFRVSASASGLAKFELQQGDGAASEVFTTIETKFNSTANPCVEFEYQGVPLESTGTANTTTVRVVKTNLDNQAQDLYSTIKGVTI